MEGFIANNTRRHFDIPVKRVKEHWKQPERHSIFKSDFDQHSPEGEGCDAYRSILISLLSSSISNCVISTTLELFRIAFKSAA